MQDNTTATDQDIGQTAKGSKANWGWGCIGVILACKCKTEFAAPGA